MIYKKVLVFLCACCIPVLSVGGVSLGMTEGDSLAKSSPYLPEVSFFSGVYDQVAASFWRPNPNQGVIQADYLYSDRKRYHFLQEGEEFNQFGIQAEGFALNSKNAFWGKADYAQSEAKQVKWTDVSDVFRLGPYLIADSIGGDSYKESYRFLGGFSIYSGKWTWGAEVLYRAGNEYRKRDPRPKTTVSDLSVKAGISYPAKNYRIGISLLGGIYRQDVSVSVYEPNTNCSFFPMKGFGLYDIKEYSYDQGFSWLYDGKSFGLDAFILPETGSGWIGNVGFGSEYIDSYAGENKYPFTFTTKTSNGSGGYKIVSDKRVTLVKAEVNYRTGKGTERVYKEEYVNDIFTDYKLISESKKYTRNQLQLQVSGLQEWLSVKQNKWLELSFGLNDYEEDYHSPSDGQVFNVRYKHLTTALKTGVEFFFQNHSSFLAEANICYMPLIQSNTIVPSGNRIFEKSMQPNLNQLETGPYGGGLKLLYQLHVNKQVKAFIATEGNCLLADSNRNRLGVRVSLGFRY